jgi:glycosyltransferase involved in cell wall biosynthesis
LRIFGTAARIHPQKRLEELLRALRLAAPRLPPYVLRIAGTSEPGTDEYADQLRRSSSDLCVEWVGEVSDMAGFHRELDLFVMVSEPAGCPNASLEAMAAGLAVIATDVGGASEQVIDGQTGRLVPKGDAEAMAQALVELAWHPDMSLRMGQAGRERIRTHFSLERMAQAYRTVLFAGDSVAIRPMEMQ